MKYRIREADKLKIGKILGIEYQKGSGLALVVLKTKQGVAKIPTDAAPTFKAFADAFGTTANALGQEIIYELDDLGVLKGFDVVGEGG